MKKIVVSLQDMCKHGVTQSPQRTNRLTSKRPGCHPRHNMGANCAVLLATNCAFCHIDIGPRVYYTATYHPLLGFPPKRQRPLNRPKIKGGGGLKVPSGSRAVNRSIVPCIGGRKKVFNQFSA